MKKIDEEILKYLSGMMNDSEMKKFEEKINGSNELNSQLLDIQKILSELDIKNIAADETYFNNLVPRIRQQLDSPKKFSVKKRIYYLAPAIVIVFLTVLFYPSANNKVGYNYQELAEIVINNIDDEDVTYKYGTQIILDPSYINVIESSDFTVGLENANGTIPDSYFKMLDYMNTETLQTLNYLPEDDLEALYIKLNDIKFQ